MDDWSDPELFAEHVPRLLLRPGGPAPASVRERLLRTLGGVERWRPFFAEIAGLFDLGEDAVAALLARVDDPAAWSALSREQIQVPGSRFIDFALGPRLPDAHAGLVRVDAGARFPRHRHLGAEVTFVLEGWLLEDSGRVHGPGQCFAHAAGSVHEFRADARRELVLMQYHHGLAPA